MLLVAYIEWMGYWREGGILFEEAAIIHVKNVIRVYIITRQDQKCKFYNVIH